MPTTSIPLRRNETAAVEITALAAGAGPPANRMATRRMLLLAAGGRDRLVIAQVLEELSCGVARAQRLESGVRLLGIGGSIKLPGISPGRNEPPPERPWAQSFLHGCVVATGARAGIGRGADGWTTCQALPSLWMTT